MMKKFVSKIALAMTVASLAVGTIAMTASANDRMFVNSEIGVNVRVEPDAGSDKLGALRYGTPVDVVKYEENGWVEINYNGQKAYVVNCLTATNPESTSDQTAKQAASQTANQAASQTANQTASQTANGNQGMTGNQQAARMDNMFMLYRQHGFMVLRSTDTETSGSNIICELPNGTVVKVIKYGDKLHYVYVPSLDQYGYISVYYINA